MRCVLHTSFALCLILTLTSQTISQERDKPNSGAAYEATWDSPEFGDISELRGKSKVYVYCEDFKIRQVIVDELKKYPRLQIVSSTDEAEFLVNFTYKYLTTYSTGIISSVKTNIHSGEFIVSIAGRVDKDNKVHQRIVWSSQNERKTTFGKNPAQKGAQKFIEAFKKVPDDIETKGTTSKRVIEPTNDPLAADALVGTWKIVASNDQGPVKEFTFTVARQGARLVGEMKSNDGTATIEQIVSDGRSFSILVSEKNGKDTLTATLTGNVILDTMKGSITLNDGTHIIPLAFIGTRAN